MKWKPLTSKCGKPNLINLFQCRILCDLQASNGSSLADIQNEVSDGNNLTQIIGNLTQMIARDLQRARNTRITEGTNEDGLRGSVGKSHSPLRSALKTSAVSHPARRDLSESFNRAGSEKVEQLQR